jgi:hypothetical protein
MRDYIFNALYKPASGYFDSRDVVATAGPEPLRFSSFLGRADYSNALSALYAASEQGWLTPAEVFAPHYSHAVARFVLGAHSRASANSSSSSSSSRRAKGSSASSAPSGLRVYEVGGGSGTHAAAFCDYVRSAAPSVYKSMSYTVLEISPRLLARQQAALQAGGHNSVARSVLCDALRARESGLLDPLPCFVVCLEVLDNLPQDKVVFFEGGGSRGAGAHETWVLEEQPEAAQQQQQALLPGSQEAQAQAQAQAAARRPSRSEDYRPLSDPLIASTLQSMGRAEAAEAELLGGGSGGSRHSAVGRALAAVVRALPLLPAGLRGGAAAQLPPAPPGLQRAQLVPTGHAALLASLASALPGHRLLASDFSALPAPSLGSAAALQAAAAGALLGLYAHPDAPAACGGPRVLGRGLEGRLGSSLLRGPLAHLHAPLLCASKSSASRATVDHATYLSPADPGSADIFFPTDFGLLAAMASAACGRPVRRSSSSSSSFSAAQLEEPGSVRVVSNKDFLQSFADVNACRTRNGYNPLLEDWTNTRWLIT